ncbi:hypothetical protein [Sanyastnella coralliicola]|uniref:hypothetical protein n=1 Tax=Sanyastnella coralliicola TaxID=3069118 RepID=UPI0027B8DE19|nr:hypothetical protein [Longitalea sp. SCSIO 12813]
MLKWLKRHSEQLEVIDFAILKLTMVGFGLMLGAVIPNWVNDQAFWLAPVIGVGMIWLAYRFLRTK